eukprot:7379466-Prymnesium_polylepis.3
MTVRGRPAVAAGNDPIQCEYSTDWQPMPPAVPCTSMLRPACRPARSSATWIVVHTVGSVQASSNDSAKGRRARKTEVAQAKEAKRAGTMPNKAF